MSVEKRPGMPGQQFDQAGGKSEEAEQVSFDELIEIIQGIQSVQGTAEKRMPSRSEEQKRVEVEDEKKRERIKEVEAAAINSGRFHYLQLTDYEKALELETNYEERKKQEIEEARKAGDDKRIQEIYNRPESWVYASAGNRITHNSVTLFSPEHIAGGIWLRRSIRNPEECLPVLVEEINRYANEYIERRREVIRAIRKRDFRGTWYETSPYARSFVGTPKAREEEIEHIQKEDIEGMIRSKDFFLRKHAEGFGRAALENKDTAVAIDNLYFAGALEEVDILAVLKAQLLEMKDSDRPEDKKRLQIVTERLFSIRDQKEKEIKK